MSIAGKLLHARFFAARDYRLQLDGRLIARIEGMREGTLRGVDFPMKRMACEALTGA